jgi:hypothetical protein
MPNEVLTQISLMARPSVRALLQLNRKHLNKTVAEAATAELSDYLTHA